MLQPCDPLHCNCRPNGTVLRCPALSNYICATMSCHVYNNAIVYDDICAIMAPTQTRRTSDAPLSLSLCTFLYAFLCPLSPLSHLSLLSLCPPSSGYPFSHLSPLSHLFIYHSLSLSISLSLPLSLSSLFCCSRKTTQ